MPKANLKKALSIVLALTLIAVAGCTGPEEKKAQRLNEAVELRAAGDDTNALAILEGLANEYPNDTDILRQIGNIYSDQGDATMAAFFIEQAYRQNPDDIELLYQTYRAQEDADQAAAAAELLETLAQTAPDAMTSELWVRLGQFRAREQKTQPALEAYLKGVNPEQSTPSSETAATIGNLFIQLDNLPQAERWFKIAANNDDPNALPALFGLLEINLRNKNWAESEAVIAQLDKQFPGALDASEWANARAELKRWRTAQDAMQAELAKAAEAKAAAEAAKAAKAEAAAAATTSSTDDLESSGKAQVIADLERAEAIADTPAIEVPPAVTAETTTPAVAEGKTITFDPSIAIEPAEPDLGIEVSFDQQAAVTPTTYTVDQDSTVIESPAPKPTTAIPPATRTQSIDELVTEAESATLDRNFKRAIAIYWQALGRANNRADIWSLLSQVYIIDGQSKNAETTALEAIRLSPGNISYTLDYLRVVQRTKAPADFLAELETAYDRFPRSPEIALSLARAYERISQNNTAADALYSRFIELAPNHPLRTEAEAALSRLR